MVHFSIHNSVHNSTKESACKGKNDIDRSLLNSFISAIMNTMTTQNMEGHSSVPGQADRHFSLTSLSMTNNEPASLSVMLQLLLPECSSSSSSSRGTDYLGKSQELGEHFGLAMNSEVLTIFSSSHSVI